MASTQIQKSLPEGFQIPFKQIVRQATRHDDALAAIGTLTGRSLEEVLAAANKLGLPVVGQFWVSENLIAKLLVQGGLVSTLWKEFTSFDTMPDVALLWVDSDPNDLEGTGRSVIFHHVRGVQGKFPSFSYIIDGYWPEPEKQVSLDLNKYAPTAYIEITAKPNGKK